MLTFTLGCLAADLGSPWRDGSTRLQKLVASLMVSSQQPASPEIIITIYSQQLFPPIPNAESPAAFRVVTAPTAGVWVTCGGHVSLLTSLTLGLGSLYLFAPACSLTKVLSQKAPLPEAAAAVVAPEAGQGSSAAAAPEPASVVAEGPPAAPLEEDEEISEEDEEISDEEA